MRTNSCLVGFSACLLAWSVSSSLHGATYALLIGVNHYPNWNNKDLKGAVNDVGYWQETLLREYSLDPQQIHLLLDKEATLTAVRREFTRLRTLLKPEDVFVLSFSGHGTQVRDQDGDEKADGFDEGLCLHDYSFSGAGVLLDDEMDGLLNSLPCRTTVVFLDCCHAGTATKSVRRAATSRSLPSPQVIPPGHDTPKTTRRADQRRIVFSACAPNQLNYEVHPLGKNETARCDGFHPEDFSMGLLTFFVLEGIHGSADVNGDGTVSYREAWQFSQRRIDAMFNGQQEDDKARQTPQMELFADEAFADEPILGLAKKAAYFAEIESQDAARVRLDLGARHGLGLDQRLSVKAAPTDALAHAEIEIDRLGIDWAEARVVSGTAVRSGEIAVAATCSSPRRQIALSVTNICEDPSLSSATVPRFERLLTESLQAIREASIGPETTADVALGIRWRSLEGGEIELTPTCLRRNGTTVALASRRFSLREADAKWKEIVPDIVEAVGKVVAETLMRDALANLTNPNAGFALQAVVNRRAAEAGRPPEYRLGEPLVFGLKSTADCWYHILAIAPDGTTHLLCPLPGDHRPATAGQKYLYPGPGDTLRFSEPIGIYVIKIVATKNPLPTSIWERQPLQLDVFREMPPSDWAEASISIRLVP